MKIIVPGMVLLVTVVLLIASLGAGDAYAYEDKALILVDETSGATNSPSSITLANLMGHFDLPYEIRTVDSYQRGDVERYRVTFYIGSTWDRELPQAFLDDVMVSDSRIVWINYNLWKLAWSDYQQQFETRFGFSYLQEAATGTFKKVTFAGRNFTRIPG